MLTHKDIPVRSFATSDEFYEWLRHNHTTDQPFWLRYYKKHTSTPTILHNDAVDVALCWGWIDGLINKYDDESYVVRFTQRRAKSIWSQVNVAKVERLIKEGRMQPSGLLHIENAQKDGRWAAAYAPASTMKVPADFIELVKADSEAWKFYQTLNKANQYTIGFTLNGLEGAKRDKKMSALVERLHQGKRLH